jgi:hypothetical protein
MLRGSANERRFAGGNEPFDRIRLFEGWFAWELYRGIVMALGPGS